MLLDLDQYLGFEASSFDIELSLLEFEASLISFQIDLLTFADFKHHSYSSINLLDFDFPQTPESD